MKSHKTNHRTMRKNGLARHFINNNQRRKFRTWSFA